MCVCVCVWGIYRGATCKSLIQEMNKQKKKKANLVNRLDTLLSFYLFTIIDIINCNECKSQKKKKKKNCNECTHNNIIIIKKKKCINNKVRGNSLMTNYIIKTNIVKYKNVR